MPVSASRDMKSTKYQNLMNREHFSLKLEQWPYVIPGGNPSSSNTLWDGLSLRANVIVFWIGTTRLLSLSSFVSASIMNLRSWITLLMQAFTFSRNLVELPSILFFVSAYIFDWIFENSLIVWVSRFDPKSKKRSSSILI